MSYNKPMIIAQNSAAGSYAAGCPAKDGNGNWYQNGCNYCERTM